MPAAKVPHVPLVWRIVEDFFLRRGCLPLFCRCFTDSGAENVESDGKKIQNGFKMDANKYPKRSTKEPSQTPPVEQDRKREEKLNTRARSFGPFFCQSL